MNVTPGRFQVVGCCNNEVAYVTLAQAENTRGIEVCGMVFCPIHIPSIFQKFLFSLSFLDLY